MPKKCTRLIDEHQCKLSLTQSSKLFGRLGELKLLRQSLISLSTSGNHIALLRTLQYLGCWGEMTPRLLIKSQIATALQPLSKVKGLTFTRAVTIEHCSHCHFQGRAMQGQYSGNLQLSAYCVW